MSEKMMVEDFQGTHLYAIDLELPMDELKKKSMIIQHNCWVKEHEKRIEDLAMSQEHREAQMRFFVQAIALLEGMKPGPQASTFKKNIEELEAELKEVRSIVDGFLGYGDCEVSLKDMVKEVVHMANRVLYDMQRGDKV